jgi:hypothetical protein
MKSCVLVLLFAISFLLSLNLAEARPGGGHSSSSGFGSGSSGSFSQGSSQPHFMGNTGIPANNGPLTALVFFGIFAFIVYILIINRKTTQTFTATPTPANKTRQINTIRNQIDLLKHSDPDFSGILLVDFVHSLYTRFYSYSTKPDFTYLTPFLSKELQHHFDQAQAWTIDEIVINGIEWLEINLSDTETESISFAINANYSLHLLGKNTRYAVSERWQLCRKRGTVSPEPEKMQTLCCPFCGAPAHFTDSGQCEHCGQFAQKGELQWYLGNRVVVRTSESVSSDLVSYTVEQGTDFPTIKQEDLKNQEIYFVRIHALPSWDGFWQTFENEIVKGYFLEIYDHWSTQDWQSVRHLLSDRLYETNLFWINMYTQNNWFNRMADLKIEQIELVKIEVDRFYEAITVRIFASCYDYTEDKKGKIIGGSRTIARNYSEYWTFVRRIGTQKHTAPYSLKQCPQCGAPADKMGQTAICGYCGSKISTGEFSWVLFLITQDDVYCG